MTIINISSKQPLLSQLDASQLNTSDATYVAQNKRKGTSGTVIYQAESFVVGRVQDRADRAERLDVAALRPSAERTYSSALLDDIGKNRETLQKLGEQRLTHTMPQFVRDSLPPDTIQSLVRNALDDLERNDLLSANQLSGKGLHSFFQSMDSLTKEYLPNYYADLTFDASADTHPAPRQSAYTPVSANQSDLDQGRTRNPNGNDEPELSKITGFINRDNAPTEVTIEYFDARDSVHLSHLPPRESGKVHEDGLSQLREDLNIFLKP